MPSDTTLVVERFRDELGDWRIVVHSPYGARVHAPWAIVIGARLREKYGVDAAAMHSDDGIVLRLPDMLDASAALGGATTRGRTRPDRRSTWPTCCSTPTRCSTRCVRSSARRRCSARGSARRPAARCCSPGADPTGGRRCGSSGSGPPSCSRSPPEYPDFPILLEAVRECLQDDFDTDALTALMRDVAARRVRVVEVTTTQPSPFAQSLLFGYTAQFLYDGDAPLAERRAAALTLDPTLLAELLGQGGESQLADLLDPDAVVRTEAELSGRAPERQAGSLEQVADVVRRHGPLSTAEVAERVQPSVVDAGAGLADRRSRAPAG